jgi:hypothetical protein
MKRIRTLLVLGAALFLSVPRLYGRQENLSPDTRTKSSIDSQRGNWIAISPFSIYQFCTPMPWGYFEYGHNFGSQNSFIVAVDFSRQPLKFDLTNSKKKGYFDFLLATCGYRRYFWQGWHIQGDLLSGIERVYK